MYAYMNTHTYDRDKQCNKSESENIYICFLRNIPNFYIYVNLIYTYFVTCIHACVCVCVCVHVSECKRKGGGWRERDFAAGACLQQVCQLRRG